MTDFKTLFRTEVHSEMDSILHSLQQKALEGRYIYRGEPTCYKDVASSLYRQCKNARIGPKSSEKPDDWYEQLWTLQKDIVVQTRRFLPEHHNLPHFQEKDFWTCGCSLRPYIATAEYKILCRIQHYGGPTNLIDFTRDYLIALFFACNKEATKRGRVIWTEEHYFPVLLTDVRVQRQKSVFIEAEGGVLSSKCYSHITIPATLKGPILMYLKQVHDISHETLFPGIQGAVQYWDSNQSPQFRVNQARQLSLKGQYAKAVALFDECLLKELNPVVLTDRAAANYSQAKWQPAWEDLAQAMTLFSRDRIWHPPAWGFALYLRGMTLIQWQRWDEAIQNLNAAKEKEFNVATEFHQDFGGITAFEDEYGLSLPDNIKEVLTNCEVEGQT